MPVDCSDARFKVINLKDRKFAHLKKRLEEEKAKDHREWEEYTLKMALLLKAIWTDPEAYSKFMANPTEVLVCEGIIRDVPGYKVVVHVDDPKKFNLSMPSQQWQAGTDDDYLKLANQVIRCCADGC